MVVLAGTVAAGPVKRRMPSGDEATEPPRRPHSWRMTDRAPGTVDRVHDSAPVVLHLPLRQ